MKFIDNPSFGWKRIRTTGSGDTLSGKIVNDCGVLFLE